jgi:hypothetical protein
MLCGVFSFFLISRLGILASQANYSQPEAVFDWSNYICSHCFGFTRLACKKRRSTQLMHRSKPAHNSDPEMLEFDAQLVPSTDQR